VKISLVNTNKACTVVALRVFNSYSGGFSPGSSDDVL
jgi:hypothetical protein